MLLGRGLKLSSNSPALNRTTGPRHEKDSSARLCNSWGHKPLAQALPSSIPQTRFHPSIPSGGAPKHFLEQLQRAGGAEAMAMAKAKSAALSVADKCRVPFASTPRARSSLYLTSLADSLLPFAEHPGRQLGSPPQHHQSRCQGKVRPLTTTVASPLVSYARVLPGASASNN
jgi:hypothetical protein